MAANATTYATAQTVVDGHPVALSGQCLACRIDGPCRHQREALEALAARGALPRRLPGATRPELIGARRVMVRG